MLYGHRLLTAVHSGRAFLIISGLAGDRLLPLEQYLYAADRRVSLYAATAFVSFFFYLLLALVVRRLLKSDADFVHGAPARPGEARRSELAGAFLVYTLLSVAFFYPILPHITSHIIGPPEDNMHSLWTVWWAHLAAQRNLGFFHTTYIFYPEGTSLLFHTMTPYNLAVATTVGWPLSPVAVYNLLILQTFLLSGVGAFLLTRHVTGDTAAALLGGFVFAFSPSHFAHSLHHLNIASVQFIPFFVLFYLKALEDGKKRDIAWASLFFLLNTLCDWTYMVYAFFGMAACYGLMAYRSRKLLLRGPLVSSLVIAGATLVALSPLVISMLVSAARHPQVWVGGHDVLTIDVAALFVPHYLHPAVNPLVARVNNSYQGVPWEGVGYLGVVCVGLLLASSRMLVERAARYVLGLLFFVVLSFGVSVHFLGRVMPTVLPYAAIQHFPILSGARAPGRLMAYAYLFLGVLAAVAFSYQRREGFLRNHGWLAALLALGICADFWIPCRQMTPVRLPPAYTAILAQERRKDFGILDLPRPRYTQAATYMMYQTLHGIPIVQGHLARKPTAALVDSLIFDNLPAQKEQLRSAHVKYIVVHKRFLTPGAGPGNWLDLDGYSEEYRPFFEDSQNLVLRVY
jgi:hypothetical protein